MSKQSKYLEKATSEASKTFSIKVISYLIVFISQVIFTRMLGANLIGLYQICMNIMMMAMMVSVLGMDSSNIKFVSEAYSKQNWSKLKAYLVYSTKVTIILSFICSLGIFIFREKIAIHVFNDKRLISILPIFCVLIIIYALIEVIGGYVRGIKCSSSYFLSQEFINKFIKLVIFLLLSLIGIKFAGLIIGTIIGFILSLVYLIYIIKNNTQQVFDKNIEKSPINKEEFWKFSLSMSVVYFTNYLMLYVNSTIVGIYLSATEVAIYSNAQNLSSFIIFIYVSFNSIFISMVSELHNNSKIKELRNLYIEITRIILLLSTPILLIILFYSKTLMGIFGERFRTGSLAFIILSLGQFFNIIVGPNESLLSMTGNQKCSMINGIIIAIVNIALNIILIPYMGIVGSAIAGNIAIVSVNIIKTIQVKHKLNILPYDKSIFKLIIITIINIIFLIIFTNIVPKNLITAIIAGIIISVISLAIYYIFGISENEKEIIGKIIKKINKK
ncbi:TPA: oligosaccharide flippase family protein [Clostridium perfringens]|uniref:oligosaccharide flippase family protein n=1 Tax=Clostridium perfringens TaxID=1502 RepID=UPI001A33148F|nr:oligosaccharide flippase family protein [Clostridium perfringens]